MKTLCVCALFVTLFGAAAFAQNELLITPSDIRLECEYSSAENPKEGGAEIEQATGFHLYIRKKNGIESVMLTETTKDPAMQEPNYAYRAQEYNPINGDEKRILNGEFLNSNYAKYSLISSTPVDDKEFTKAFHIYIPATMVYGYDWARHGTVKIGRGTFVNIRSFSKLYCDYSGTFYDNPYMFDLVAAPKPDLPPPPPTPAPVTPPPPPPPPIVEPAPKEEPAPKAVPALTDDYNPDTAQKFSEVALTLTYSKGPETITEDIMTILEGLPIKRRADIVFAIDATGSMKDDIARLRQDWVPRLIDWITAKNKQIRIGLLLYRDYGDSYRYKGLPIRFFEFTTNVESFKKNLNSFVIKGTEGGDIPEAVYEALYGSVMFYKWDKNALRKIILIGDAPPHPTPRNSGIYSKELVQKLAKEKSITIEAIITPDDKARRGR